MDGDSVAYYGRTLKEAWDKLVKAEGIGKPIYEYKCPYCGHVNERKGYRALVVCDWCKKSFRPQI